MSDFLRPDPGDEPSRLSVPGLAHVGDAVYELMVRTWLCTGGISTAKSLHKLAVGRVSAKAQAEAAAFILPLLDDEELAVFKRGRNTHLSSVPHGATYEEYHAATGLEALFGYLYLSGRTSRLNELFRTIIDSIPIIEIQRG